MNPVGATRRKASTLVTVVAWLALLSGCFAVFTGAVGVFVRQSLYPAVTLLGGIAAIVPAWGLRWRREWARRGIIAVCAYAALTGLVGAATLRQTMERQLAARLGRGQAAQIPREQLDAIAGRMQSFVTVSAIVFAMLDGLIILKMTSKSVREEFDAA